MGTKIIAERLLSESRQIKIHIEDPMTFDDYHAAEHYVYRRNINNSTEFPVRHYTENGNNSDEITIKNDTIYIDFYDEADLHGTEYIYVLKKIDQAGREHIYDSLPIITLPDKIKNFRINLYKSVYDNNELPEELNLNWTPLDTESNNLKVYGYHIYYSLSERGSGTWGPWRKLRGTSTEDETQKVNLISRYSNEINIKVPQVSNIFNPHDIRFTIVAIAQSSQIVHSRFSSIAPFILHNVQMNLISTKGGIITLPESENSRPVTIEAIDGAFDSDTTLMLSKTLYNAHISNFDFKYTYEIKANNELKKWLNVSIKVNLFHGQKHEIRILDEHEKWTPVPSTYDLDKEVVSFSLTKLTKFVLLIKNPKYKENNNKHYSKFNKFTNKIISKLPTWSKIKRNPSISIGAHFLDVVGLEFEDMKFILNYAEKQTYIGTADINQADIIYKAKLPDTITNDDKVVVKTSTSILEQTFSLEDFFHSSDDVLRPTIYYDNPYIVDYKDKYVYVRKEYEKSQEFKHGKVLIEIYRGLEEDPSYEEIIYLELHHVWNFFDEFGLLLNTPRLPGERNKDYKERILDVFKNKSNATGEGLLNGIARELGIRKNTTWKDSSQDFIIKEPMVVVNMIKVNGKKVDTKDIFFTSKDYVVIKAKEDIPNNSIVSYVTGLEMHTFNKEHDNVFKQQLYNVDGTATNLFKYYADLIKQRIPIEWGQFKWNEGYWDTGNIETGGQGCLPSLYDGNIIGFLKLNSNDSSKPQPNKI